MTFAERLQELRQKAGLTQAALADASSVPLWTVRNYEQCRREPNWKAAIQLARALRVPVEAFADCASQDAEEAAGPKNRPRPRKGK